MAVGAKNGQWAKSFTTPPASMKLVHCTLVFLRGFEPSNPGWL
jgi:hypothetical protein